MRGVESPPKSWCKASRWTSKREAVRGIPRAQESTNHRSERVDVEQWVAQDEVEVVDV